MGSSDILTLVKNTFSASPSLAIALVLSLWLARAWWFRLVEIGTRKSFPSEILSGVRVTTSGGRLSLLDLGRLTADAQDDSGSLAWTVTEIFMVSWTIQARAWVVKFTTAGLLFVVFCLGVMRLAQPAGGVSLSNVTQLAGLACLIPLCFLVALAVALVISSAHTLPAARLRKAADVLLTSW